MSYKIKTISRGDTSWSRFGMDDGMPVCIQSLPYHNSVVAEGWFPSNLLRGISQQRIKK